MLERRDFLGYAEVWHNNRWYEPPIPMVGLARAYDMSPHHRSALLYKRNQLLRHFVPMSARGRPIEPGSGEKPLLSRHDFGELVINFLAMGNGYLERRDNLAGRPLALINAPAIHTRRGVEDDVYWWVPALKQETSFREGHVFHMRETDLRQEIYGLPEYTSALQAGLLNHDATCFRRKYYLNGSHMGYILYISEATFEDADAEALEEALDRSKGPGNFRNLMLHLPNGKEKGVQVIPVGEATAKDEFLGIKNTTRDDILAAHRVPPVLLGVVPQVTGGFGKPGEAADAFYVAEIDPLWMRLLEINEWLGAEAVRHREYERQAVTAPAAAA